MMIPRYCQRLCDVCDTPRDPPQYPLLEHLSLANLKRPRSPMKIAIALFATLLLIPAAVLQGAAPAKPNIIFIFSDDHA